MNFDEIIDRRGTHCVKYSDQKQRQRPADAIVMTLADMDLPCCEAIPRALQQRCQHPVFGYQQFDELLPQQVVKWYRAASGAQLDPQHFLAAPSVNTAIAWLIRALSQPGEGVLIQDPSYSPFRKITELNGRRCLFNPLRRREDHYELDLDDFQQQCRQARLFLLCSPHNPTSHVFTRQQLAAMLEICRRHQVTVIADEIHSDWVYGTMTAASALDPQVITLLSGSKTFNLQGMQSSFLFVPDTRQRQAVRHQMDMLGYMNNQTLSHTALLAAYSEEGAQWLAQAKEYVQASARRISEAIARHALPLRAMSLQSTYLMWIDCSPCCRNDEDVVDLFERRCHIYGTSGSHYHIDEPFIRLNIGLSHALIDQVIQRLHQALK